MTEANTARRKAMKTLSLKIAVLSALIVAFLVPYKQADAQVTVSGGVSISGGVSVGAPPPVIVAPAPPPVVIQPAPAIIVAPAPAPVVVAPVPPPKIVIKTPPLRPPFQKQVGLGFRLDGAFHGHEDLYDGGMGGAGLLLRLRLLPHFATELALDAYGGQGYEGVKRVEVPFSIGLMWMPMYYLTRVQFYTIAGMGGVFARVGEEPYMDKPFYLGGFLGLGFEIKLGVRRNFALFWDIRGFIRKRLNDRPDDPYIPSDGSCRYNVMNERECTDWEGGMTMSIGAVLYF
jgi:hypothetical protein